MDGRDFHGSLYTVQSYRRLLIFRIETQGFSVTVIGLLEEAHGLEIFAFQAKDLCYPVGLAVQPSLCNVKKVNRLPIVGQVKMDLC